MNCLWSLSELLTLKSSNINQSRYHWKGAPNLSEITNWTSAEVWGTIYAQRKLHWVLRYFWLNWTLTSDQENDVNEGSKCGWAVLFNSSLYQDIILIWAFQSSILSTVFNFVVIYYFFGIVQALNYVHLRFNSQQSRITLKPASRLFAANNCWLSPQLGFIRSSTSFWALPICYIGYAGLIPTDELIPLDSRSLLLPSDKRASQTRKVYVYVYLCYLWRFTNHGTVVKLSKQFYNQRSKEIRNT